LRKAIGAFVVFDLSNRRTFESAGYWVRELREKAVENVSILLVGNKADKNREVVREEAAEWARQQNLGYAETSAADLRSLNAIFVQLCSSTLAFT
jgi:GTPase SAR1 family protein